MHRVSKPEERLAFALVVRMSVKQDPRSVAKAASVWYDLIH